MKKITVSLLILAAAILPLAAGPFGLEMGMTLEQVKEACGGRDPILVSADMYAVIPQKPHPYFTLYAAFISSTHGLYYIKAIGAEIATSGYGIELKGKYKSLIESLSKVYGTAKSVDFLMYDSIWDDAGDWMSGIVHKDRHVYSSWTPAGTAESPSSIAGVYMGVQAENSSTGKIVLEYEFTNAEKAEAEKKEAEASVF